MISTKVYTKKLNHNFSIEDFEGPLDLLLFLIKKGKKDILKINIFELTNQYLEFINENINNNLEISSEYLFMSAYLIELKSKSLIALEKVLNQEIDIEYENIDKEELIEKLLEYERYKEIAVEFQNLEDVRRKNIDKQSIDNFEIKKIINRTLDESHLNEDNIILAIKRMIERIKQEKPLESKIDIKRISVIERTAQIKNFFEKHNKKKRVNILEFFDDTSNMYIAITLLTLLEMAKDKFLTITQDKLFDEIYINWGR